MNFFIQVTIWLSSVLFYNEAEGGLKGILENNIPQKNKLGELNGSTCSSLFISTVSFDSFFTVWPLYVEVLNVEDLNEIERRKEDKFKSIHLIQKHLCSLWVTLNLSYTNLKVLLKSFIDPWNFNDTLQLCQCLDIILIIIPFNLTRLFCHDHST